MQRSKRDGSAPRNVLAYLYPMISRGARRRRFTAPYVMVATRGPRAATRCDRGGSPANEIDAEPQDLEKIKMNQQKIKECQKILLVSKV